VAVSSKKLYARFRRLGVLRPMAEKAAQRAQEAWKRGAIDSRAGEGLRRGEAVLRRLAAEEKVSSLAPIRRRSL
jgi:hypothetical protein